MIHAKVTLKLALENRLAAFVAGLATAPARLERYQQDPEAEMAAAGLSEQDKEGLRSGDWKLICELMASDATRPMSL